MFFKIHMIYLNTKNSKIFVNILKLNIKQKNKISAFLVLFFINEKNYGHKWDIDLISVIFYLK